MNLNNPQLVNEEQSDIGAHIFPYMYIPRNIHKVLLWITGNIH